MEQAAWVLLIAPVLVYAGYPLLLLTAAAFVRPRRAVAPGPPPAVAIIICAHNEAARIGEKLASVLTAVARWPGRAEILVGDDGSTDRTGAVAAGFADRGVRLVTLPRGGKAAALAVLVRSTRAEILVMTDADPLFDGETLPALLAPFADPGVGAVAGSVELVRAARAGRFAVADRTYRAYESAMRAAEDRLFGCVSADGGLYAIRAALMPPVPADVTDDFWISTAAVAAGKRIAFAANARVREHSIAGARQQFRRRVRITVRGLTGLWRRRALMNPARTGWYAIALILHKLARRLAPLAIPPLWGLSGVLALRGSAWWALVFAGLTAAALLGLAGHLAPVRLPRPVRIAHGAVLHLGGLAAGALLFLAGRRYTQWTPQKEPAR